MTRQILNICLLVAALAAAESSWPPGDAADATVLQVASSASVAQQYHEHIASIRSFAAERGYGYRLVLLEEEAAAAQGGNSNIKNNNDVRKRNGLRKGPAVAPEDCVYTAKVRAIKDALDTLTGRRNSSAREPRPGSDQSGSSRTPR